MFEWVRSFLLRSFCIFTTHFLYDNQQVYVLWLTKLLSCGLSLDFDFVKMIYYLQTTISWLFAVCTQIDMYCFRLLWIETMNFCNVYKTETSCEFFELIFYWVYPSFSRELLLALLKRRFCTQGINCSYRVMYNDYLGVPTTVCHLKIWFGNVGEEPPGHVVDKESTLYSI